VHDGTAVRAVILDRDGVLNRQVPDGYLTDIAHWEWLPGALDACRELTAAGYRVAVVTNQSGLARGLLTADRLARIHDRMLADLAGAGVTGWPIFYCPHHPDHRCPGRKPAPGMVQRALNTLRVRPDETVLIGDHETDIEAAAQAGCRSIHVRCGRNTGPTVPAGCSASVPDLLAAVRLLPTLGSVTVS
jgi:D-glycero-D-manno-heptose 1,7-bisphosphate phosphatase